MNYKSFARWLILTFWDKYYLMIYFFVLILLLFLSFRYDINGKTKGREKWYIATLVILILLAGLRWRIGTDTPNYLRYFYHYYPTLGNFTFEEYPVGRDPFYVLINSIIKSVDGRFYMVQIIQATIVNTLIFKYFRKHCNYIFTCVLFYFLAGYISYSMEIMRASISIAICLWGNDYILEKKWVKGYFLYVLALMFHSQTIVMFVLPVLFFLRLNKLGIVAMIVAFIMGYFIQSVFGEYLMLLDLEGTIADKAENYIESERFGEQTRNINFVIVSILPNVIYGLIALYFLKKYNWEQRLLSLEPMIMIGLIFLMLQLNMQIAYRFVDYYRVYFIMYCAECFIHLTRQKRLSFGVSYFRAMLLFLPFLFFSAYNRLDNRYHPYSSVIEKSISKSREKRYNANPNMQGRRANPDEY